MCARAHPFPCFYVFVCAFLRAYLLKCTIMCACVCVCVSARVQDKILNPIIRLQPLLSSFQPLFTTSGPRREKQAQNEPVFLNDVHLHMCVCVSILLGSEMLCASGGDN